MTAPLRHAWFVPSRVPPLAGRLPATALVLLLSLFLLPLTSCVDSARDPVAVDEESSPPLDSREGLFLLPPGPPICVDGEVSGTGALVRACVPKTGWNGDLVAWAHGYVSPREPLAIPDDEVGGQAVADIIAALGYGYVTTSYRDNGLIADQAVGDLDDAVTFFKKSFEKKLGPVDDAFLVGGSEGGLATALSLEGAGRGLFDAGMILCAPVGSFQGQIRYFGDFRVLLDVYFPDVVPGDPWGKRTVEIPRKHMDHWRKIQKRLIVAARDHPARMAELLRVAGVAADRYNPETLAESAVGVLWYNIFATNDIMEKVGGLPYDNTRRWYRGSANDWRLNREVQRIRAQVPPGMALAPFETDGSLTVPAVGMHTTLDPIVPFSQGLRYRFETLRAGVGFGYNFFPVRAYGHCAFGVPHVLAGFALMVLKATGSDLVAFSTLFSEPADEATFLAAAHELGADPVVARREGRKRK
jgi:hypothetical protein